MSFYYKPISAYHFWEWLDSQPYTDTTYIKMYLLKILKFYVKKYPEMVRTAIQDHRHELSHYIDTEETQEKILAAYIKNRMG